MHFLPSVAQTPRGLDIGATHGTANALVTSHWRCNSNWLENAVCFPLIANAVYIKGICIYMYH